MEISTIVTFTIKNDSARDALIEILENLGFTDANDQSTMICSRKIPKRTIDTVNKYCKEQFHEFEEDDTISTYASYIKEGKSFIQMLDYFYDRNLDEFL